MQSTLGMGAKRPEDKNWWDDLPEPAKIDIQPTGQEAIDLAKAQKVRHGFCLIFFNIIIRIYCFIVGVLMIAYGGWILSQIGNSEILPLPIIANVCMGGFLVIAGLLTVLAESRNRKTMDRCLNTYIIVANHLARGIFYLVVGALTFPIDVGIPFIGEFGNSKVLAGFIVAGGIMNIVYYPFNYQYHRKKAVSEQPRGIANAEELAYDMHVIYTAGYKAPVAPVIVDAAGVPVAGTFVEVPAAPVTVVPTEVEENGANIAEPATPAELEDVDLASSKTIERPNSTNFRKSMSLRRSHGVPIA